MQLPVVHAEGIKIFAGSYFDSYTREFVKDQLITVCPDRGIIVDIHTISSETEVLLETPRETLIDLRRQTVLPGFVDAHVHCKRVSIQLTRISMDVSLVFLHPYSDTSWEDQVTRESIVERTVRAITHAKKTLLAGFTTVRQAYMIP